MLPWIAACEVQERRPFRVGTNVWPGYETLYLARELGAYRNSDIKLVELPNASEVIQALRNGTLEAAALTLDEALSVAQDGYDLRVALIMDFSRGGDALIGGADVATLGDIRGRRVGVESTAVGAILLDAALRSAGMSVADVELVPLTVDEHYDAFASREVDAVVTFEPVRTRLLDAGGSPLFDSSRIPNRIVDVLVVPADVAQRRPDSLRTLLHGHFMALDYMRADTDEAMRIIAARMHLEPDALAQLFAGLFLPGLVDNHHLLAAGQAGLQRSLAELVELMHARGMLHRKPDTAGMLSASWLPAR
ncbi:MAG: ABC transporter substrate-binding protein [Gammaproteobacteria bacterium]|nr:ABC transporter substrate-binding protein [Gammaproteobacteria bacterium]